MTKWAYMRYPVIPGRGGPNVAALDQLGAEGWELVCFTPDDPADGASGYLLFKRPKAAGQEVDPGAFRGQLTQAEWRRPYEGNWAAAEEDEDQRR